MRKTLKKYLFAFVTLGIWTCLYSAFDTNAEENVNVSKEVTSESTADDKESLKVATVSDADISKVVYNDSNVSITSALDRYLAFNSDSALDVILGDSAVIKVEAEEVKEDESTKKSEAAESGDYINFSDKAIVMASGQVNIRKDADVNSGKIGIISNGGLVTVVEKGSEWSHIKSGACDGYIKNEFLTFGDDAKKYAEKNLSKVAVVNATTLRLRESDSEESNCLTLLTGGEEYDILSQGNSWTKVLVDDSLSGYVKNEYISISYRTGKAVAVTDDSQNTNTTEQNTAQVTEAPSTEAPTTETPVTEAPVEEESLPPAPAVNPNVSEVVNYALQFVGNPYVYGGSSLTDGTDCSGFTMSVYANFGVYLPHSSKVQANCGTEVSLSEVAPGDIIFYKNGGTTVGHAALYIGGGQVVHACNEKVGIIVSNMYYSTPCKAIRVY